MNRIVVGSSHDVIADRLAGGPDGRWAAIEAASLVTVVDADGVMELPEIVGPGVGEVAFSLDGSELLAAPHRFRFARGEWVFDPLGVETPGPASGASGRRRVAACWSPDGESLVAVEQIPGRREQTIVWRRGEVAHSMVGVDHWSAKQQVATADLDGPVVVIGSTFLEVWHPMTQSVRWQSDPGRWQITRLLCVGELIVTGDAGGTVAAVSLADGIPHWTFELTEEVTGLASVTAASVGAAVAVSTASGEVLLLDLHGGELGRVRLDGPIADLAANAPDRLLAAMAAPATGVTELVLSG